MNETIHIKVFPVIFRRTLKSDTERGIGIGNEGDVEVIIDRKFKPVKTLWCYTILSGEGCLPIEL